MSPLFPSYQAAAEYRRDMAIIPDAPHGHTSHRRRRKSRRKRMGGAPCGLESQLHSSAKVLPSAVLPGNRRRISDVTCLSAKQEVAAKFPSDSLFHP